jgi:hypothetical protein
MERILDLLSTCQTDGAVMPPTTLYNEGWMLRLVLSWFAAQPPEEHPLAFLPGSRWYSEALLTSPFGPGPTGTRLSESGIRADGIIGHFRVRPDHHVELNEDARQMVLVDAKMFGGFSDGATIAPAFNQASRQVACIAEALRRADRPAREMERVGFAVLAPAEQVDAGVFSRFLTGEVIRDNVWDRVQKYGGATLHSKRPWFEEWFEPTLERIDLSLISWESVVEAVAHADPAAAGDLAQFLSVCMTHNRPPQLEQPLAG